MFATSTRRRLDPGALQALSDRVRPISTARAQRLPAAPSLRALLPAGLRRGTAIGVTADEAGGSTTMALALAGAATQAGSWCAAVGLADLGALAAEEAGVDLSRLVCIPRPGAHWAQTVAELLDGFDLVILCPPHHVRPALARRVVARLRDRRAVLLVIDRWRSWPEPCDLDVRVEMARWVSIGPGEDCLRHRQATVSVDGRRAEGRRRAIQLWLPAADGALADVSGR
ncbi:MAG TPA: hypothetical protein VIJ60_12145 [Acidimicrobiales bacterium]